MSLWRTGNILVTPGNIQLWTMVSAVIHESNKFCKSHEGEFKSDCKKMLHCTAQPWHMAQSVEHCDSLTELCWLTAESRRRRSLRKTIMWLRPVLQKHIPLTLEKEPALLIAWPARQPTSAPVIGAAPPQSQWQEIGWPPNIFRTRWFWMIRSIQIPVTGQGRSDSTLHASDPGSGHCWRLSGIPTATTTTSSHWGSDWVQGLFALPWTMSNFWISGIRLL